MLYCVLRGLFRCICKGQTTRSPVVSDNVCVNVLSQSAV